VYAKPEDPSLSKGFDLKDPLAMAIARDRSAFHCKAIPALQEARDVDDSFASLAKIQVKDVKQDDTLRGENGNLLVPCFALK
jgi:hypothetical protein